MQIIIKYRLIIVIAVGIITGFMLNDYFSFLKLLIGTVFASILIILAALGDVVTKSSNGTRIAGYLFLFFLIAAISSFASQTIAQQSSKAIADKIIKGAFEYKRSKGYFPGSVDNLAVDTTIINQFKKGQGYWIDSAKQNFTIRSRSDGWNVKMFYSSDSSWVTTD